MSNTHASSSDDATESTAAATASTLANAVDQTPMTDSAGEMHAASNKPVAPRSRGLSRRGRLLVTFTFFSMFFGAGNLIFPPILGAQAGGLTWQAAAGFIVSGVGLPIMGVLAVTTAGGFDALTGRVSKHFSAVFGLIIILTIGPFFAIPRTATTSFEMAVVPFTPGAPRWLTQLLYSAVFFAVAYLLAQHPDKLATVIGRFTGPLLLIFIAVLFVGSVVAFGANVAQPSGNYEQHQVAQGFLDGYQTMDMLAALYFGIVISANIRAMGVETERSVRRETGMAGLGTGVLLGLVYAVLAYVGAVGGALRPVDPDVDTGATVLTTLTSALFGTWGTAFIGLIFVLACLNVCTGLISTCSVYFQERFPRAFAGPRAYRVWSTIFTVFSFGVSNIGLSWIIKISLPVLAALYPIAIVLVLLALLHRPFTSRFPRVYFWTVVVVGIVAVAQCVASMAETFGGALPWLRAGLGYLPFETWQLGWVVPAAIGVVIGVIDSVARARRVTSV